MATSNIRIGSTRWTYLYAASDGDLVFAPVGDGVARIVAVTRPARSYEPLLAEASVVLTADDITMLIVTYEDESETVIRLR